MDGLGKAAGIVAVVAAALEALMAAFSLFGMAMGGVMMSGALPHNPSEPDPAAMGGLLMGLYVAFFVFAVVGAILHMVAGVQMLRNKPNRTFLWVATVGSIAPMATIYCSLTAIPVAILLLLWLLKDAPDPVP